MIGDHPIRRHALSCIAYETMLCGLRDDGWRSGKRLWGPALVNEELKAARRADEILSIVADRGERLDSVNVATAVNRLYKVANAR